MAPVKRMLPVVMSAALAVAAGCSGKIGSGSSTGAGGSGAGAGPGPGAGGASAGTSGIVTGVGGNGIVIAPTSPGVVVVRRLNHSEYNNTVRDLLETTLTPANGFPADDLGGEFDTVGSALSLSPSYVMAYETAAHALVADLYAGTAARRQRIVPCNIDTGGDTCAQTVLSAFARRAWRRPVTAEELQGLLLPVTTARTVGATATDGLRYALAAVLMSPHFIFKVELDPDPASAQPRRLSSHELATRMSYALWSSTPDEMLLTAADNGQLSTDDEISTQIDRLLADARADALLDDFAGQWLDYKSLESHEVDARTFPRYTPALARSMRLEARRYVQEFLRSDLPVSQILSSRFTFLDSTLATHYGLTRSGGAATDFVRVDTSAAPRAGLLTLGAFLTATSLPARTSPVKRGEFIFTRLLCGTIMQPPPDVPQLPEDAASGLSLRQRLEAHRASPNCMPCHAIMDPLGFGLENFDAIGAHRTMDGTATINATGTMPNGTPFDGAAELSAALAADPSFADCVTRKFMTFAVGRLLNQPNDATWVAHLAGRARESGSSLKTIIRTVMLSEGFRSRQAQQM